MGFQGADPGPGETPNNVAFNVIGSATANEDALYKIYLVQEFCSLGSLADAIKERRFWEAEVSSPRLSDLLAVAADVAAGMAHIHSRNIIHGDLKCTNVLLLRADSPSKVLAKIADFGLSVKLPRN